MPPFATELRRLSSSDNAADPFRPHAPFGLRASPRTFYPRPPSNLPRLAGGRSTAASPRGPSQPALRAIRHPDACERLAPLVVLFGISMLLFLMRGVVMDSRNPYSAGVLYYVLEILVVLLLVIWRPSMRIPAVAENGDSNPPPACRRSLSSTHFAQERPGCAGGNGRGRCAPRAVRPEACGLLQAPLRLGVAEEPSRRKWMARLLTQTRRPMPPAPEGR